MLSAVGCVSSSLRVGINFSHLRARSMKNRVRRVGKTTPGSEEEEGEEGERRLSPALFDRK